MKDLYDLLSPGVRYFDRDYSNVNPGEETLLEKALYGPTQEAASIEDLIEGLGRLVDTDLCPDRYLSFLAYMLELIQVKIGMRGGAMCVSLQSPFNKK